MSDELDVEKNREGASEGAIGFMVIDWLRCDMFRQAACKQPGSGSEPAKRIICR